MLGTSAVLVVDQTQVVGVFSEERNSAERRCETVPYCHSLEPSQKPFVLFGLPQNLFRNGRSVLPSVTLTEDEKRRVTSDSYLQETAVLVVVQLVERNVKIVGNFSHVGDISFRVVGVGIAESCSHGLIDEENVIG